MKHKYYECLKPCETQYCQYCEGGLASCTVCGGGEGSLPTECPGDRMMYTLERAVHQGRVDFKDGQWRGFAGSHAKIRDRPEIITLCGSTRFTSEMLREAWRLTIAGNIVIHWNILEGKEAFAHGAEREGGNVKQIIDALYLHKVAMADEVRILNVGGYVGESTRGELAHARKLGKEITWLEPDHIPENLW